MFPQIELEGIKAPIHGTLWHPRVFTCLIALPLYQKMALALAVPMNKSVVDNSLHLEIIGSLVGSLRCCGLLPLPMSQLAPNHFTLGASVTLDLVDIKHREVDAIIVKPLITLIAADHLDGVWSVTQAMIGIGIGRGRGF